MGTPIFDALAAAISYTPADIRSATVRIPTSCWDLPIAFAEMARATGHDVSMDIVPDLGTEETGSALMRIDGHISDFTISSDALVQLANLLGEGAEVLVDYGTGDVLVTWRG